MKAKKRMGCGYRWLSVCPWLTLRDPWLTGSCSHCGPSIVGEGRAAREPEEPPTIRAAAPDRKLVPWSWQAK